MRILVALWTLALAACGSGGIQSPDFTRLLAGLEIRDSAGLPIAETGVSAPVGTTVQLTALGRYTTPPGAPSQFTEAEVGAEWASSAPTVATVDPRSGLVTPVAAGVTTITAKSGDFTDSVIVTVTGALNPGDVVALAIAFAGDPALTQITTDALPKGAQRTYIALAVLRTGATRPVAASWTSDTPASLEVVPLPADPTTTKSYSVSSAAVVGSTPKLTATATAAALGTAMDLTADVTVTILDGFLSTFDSVLLVPNPVNVGSTGRAFGLGTFSTSAGSLPFEIRTASLTWTSVPTTGTAVIASILADGGIYTGVSPGTTTITGTLKDGLETQVTGPRSRSAVLTVTRGGSTNCPPGQQLVNGVCTPCPGGVCPCDPATGQSVIDGVCQCPTGQVLSGGVCACPAGQTCPGTAVCPQPIVGSTTVVTPILGPLCLGCSVTDPAVAPGGTALTDNNPANFATVSILASLLDPLLGGLGLDASAAVQVSKPTQTAAGGKAGFILGFPVAGLLSLELINQIQVQTYDGTTLKDTATLDNGLLAVDLVGMTLLPGVSDGTELFSLGLTTTAPFTGLRVTYTGGVATVLSDLQVYNACSVIVPGSTGGSGGLPGGVPGIPSVPGIPGLPFGDLLGGLPIGGLPIGGLPF